ncbi:hypothetical protein ABH989_004354 [Bradyrhizobium ottawaense]|uniref:TIR domain-containing protein n=1 Tax=Bradyrhizobium ottawaense TaxID=931866 RepID=UPI003510E6AB
MLAPDDVTTIRDATVRTARDNVVFELGLFIGRLGSDRCFLIVPRGLDNLHLPTDLLGLTPATYDSDRQDENLVAALGPACSRIRKAIKRLGRVSTIVDPPVSSVPVEAGAEVVGEELCSDPVDCEALIRSWMGSRPASENTLVIRYADVDRNLKLQPGSAVKYIERAAAAYKYEADLKGKDTITFKKPAPTRRVISTSW